MPSSRIEAAYKDLLIAAEEPALKELLKECVHLPDRPTYRKYTAGLAANLVHIKRHVPELLEGDHHVLDIGPGTGCFLLLARAFGSAVEGIDAVVTTPVVQDYERLTGYWGLRVAYKGVRSYLENNWPLGYSSYSIIHMRGSLDAVLRECKQPFEETIPKFLSLLERNLHSGGAVWIGHNIERDTKQLVSCLRAAADEGGFLFEQDSETVTRLRLP
jgi:hypothetical protein